MDLDVLSWNCRGICRDSTVRALKDVISQTRPQIVFLCETKINNSKAFEDLRLSLGFAHGKGVLSAGLSGGLGMFWNGDVKVIIGSSSLHHIDAEIDGDPGNPRWRLTGFYGWPRTEDRDRSLQLLRDLSDLNPLPWVVVGDLNEILNSGEKKDGGPLRPERQMRGFRESLGYGDLLDLGYHGPCATWWNSETQLRLDRAVCTPTSCDIFGHARLQHRFRSCSHPVKSQYYSSPTTIVLPSIQNVFLPPTEFSEREVESLVHAHVAAQVTTRQESRLGWPSLRFSDA
ncbi:hypothetical protein ACLB2K_047682 [Fragaria x ananassa]